MQKPNPDAQHFLHSDADPLKNTYNNLMDSRRRGREQMSLGHHPSFCTGLKWTSKRRHNMFIQQELMRKTFYSLSLSLPWNKWMQNNLLQAFSLRTLRSLSQVLSWQKEGLQEP